MSRSAVLALVLVLTGVSLPERASQGVSEPNLVLLLASDQPEYRVGGAASFTLAVDNPSGVAVTVAFRSGQRYDVAVFAGEQEVWRWSADRAFTDAETELLLPPGVTLLDRVTWDWRDARGAPLPPGTYRVVGSLTTTPPQTGNVLEIRLVEGSR